MQRGPSQTSKMESFATIVDGQKQLANVAKLSKLDIRGGMLYLDKTNAKKV